MATQAGCALVTFILFLYYQWQNKKRGAASESEDSYMAPEVWANMTDRENKKFKYSY